jgi:CubicO group peptidase (beta-lactamase class C family)
MSLARSQRPPGITLANWREHPHSRWSFQHVRQLLATASIAHLPNSEPDPLVEQTPAGIEVDPALHFAGGDRSLYSLLDQTYSDGMLVLHNGRGVGSWYADHFDPINPHILFSVSKSANR